jgi:2-polyprenyl-3-methyl-5-hydroxy-6-metoxy-1,4-benzoquinol methylase
MELWIVFLIVFAIASLYYIANSFPDESIQEGFEDIEESGVKENGVIHWLNNNELYDKFYATVYDKLTQCAQRTKAEVGLMLVEWTKRADDKKNFQILDIGCGTGIAPLAFADLGVKKIVGLDSSEAMLNKAKEYEESDKLTSEQRASLEWRLGDMNDSTVCSAGEFTHIYFMYFSIYYAIDKEAIFRNCYLWSKPGAELAVAVVNKHKFDPMLESAVPTIGFSLQKYSDTRLTKSEVTFNKFKYTGEFHLTDPRAEFRETFRFNSGKVRRQKHNLKMEDINTIVGYAKAAGWNYKGFTDLVNVGFEYAYQLYFSRG